MKEYYVYEWIRLDTNEPFYVGKGKGNRWKELKRGNNKHFNNIVKSIPVVVNILHDNLDEQIAFDLETWYIWQYRDVIGYEMCNTQDGGEGHGLHGALNGMYGKKHSEKTKNKISENHIDVNGKNNPMFNKNYRDYMTEEALREHDKKISEANKGKSPWKNKTEKEIKDWKRKISETRKGKYSGKDCCNAKSVICLTTKRIFFTTKEGSEFYHVDNSSIVKCCKNKYKSAGKSNGKPLIWKYLIWKHNKKYRIKKEEYHE